ncbi:MAG: ABC transporter ATP-binding protein [Alphaproteobacteria bacterium]|nr:ABC transporter ATP-binding protein [Alphaproteobacteria bacterium SS10]
MSEVITKPVELEAEPSPPLLSARGITRIIDGEVPATLVKYADLDIKAGEFVAIMGPSGSGKSSLLYLLGLLDMPTSGHLYLEGHDVAGLAPSRLAHIRLEKLGFVFQFHFLLPEFSALENVMLPMQRLGRLTDHGEIEARATNLLTDLDLADHIHKRPGQMSGGQRQRVAIARALANEAPIILADEPTGNLDTASSETVRNILRRIVDEEGRTVIAVTHEPDFAEAADRIIRIVDGEIAS